MFSCRSEFTSVMALMLMTTAVWASEFTAEIKADKTREPISDYIYGQFIEHVGKCIDGGIWAEMVEDRKFFYPACSDKSAWQLKGVAGCIGVAGDRSFVGRNGVVVSLDSQIDCGIYQDGFGFIKGKDYIGYVILSGNGFAGSVKVTLSWGASEKDSQTVCIKNITSKYTKYPLSFKAGKTTYDGTIEISAKGSGSFTIGTVSLMPADNIKGFRADTLALLKELDAPIYRWPGGCFVGGYKWKPRVYDRDKREPGIGSGPDKIENNEMGINEFIELCRLLNAEPLLVVDSGTGNTVEDVAEEVQYCNGSIDTPMGKLRADMGYPEPFNVKWWGIGNEMYGFWQVGNIPIEEYPDKHNACAKAMRAEDDSIKIITVGWTGDWSKKMLEKSGDYTTLMSEHCYVREPADNVAEHVNKLVWTINWIAGEHRKYRQEIAGLAEKNIKVAMDEWGYWYGPYLYGNLGTRYFMKDALGIAAGFHAFFNNSDIIEMATYAQTVNVIGAIKTNKTDACFSTIALPMVMYRKHFGKVPVEITGDFNPVDICAAWTEDKKALTVAMVNPLGENCEVMLNIKAAKLTGKGSLWRIGNVDPMAYNDPGREWDVKIKENSFTNFEGKTKLPPYSVSLYRLNVQ